MTATAPEVTPGRAALDRLFRPHRVAIVGASDKNMFSRRAFAQHARLTDAPPLALVNPRQTTVHGVAAVPSCKDIEGGVDCVYLMTPQRATDEALVDAAEAGARAAVVLSQGWAEAGAEGREQQAQLVARAQELGVVLLGPNHLGFANIRDGVLATALGLDLPLEPGAFGLVSQSGALASSMISYAARNGVRFSFVVTTGNEAMVAVADVLDYLVADEGTRAISVFAETIRKPEVFLAAAERAREAGKAIVILKAGASELAARTAAAHTGALVGDNKVLNAVFRQNGITRVGTLEDLIATGDLCARVGPLAAPGIGVLSISGGACDLVADRGEELGLELPELSEATHAALHEALPSFGHAQNPLDVTGAALADPELWIKSIGAVAADPAIGLLGLVTSMPSEHEPHRAEAMNAIGEGLARVDVPGVVCPQIETASSDFTRQALLEARVDNALPSVERFAVAAAGLQRWSRWLSSRSTDTGGDGDGRATVDLTGVEALIAGPMSELTARRLLDAAGVPSVPAELTGSAQAAAAAARGFAEPAALKLCSPDVLHKSEVGGVELGLSGDADVAGAYDRILAAAAQHVPEARIEGVLVSPMRKADVELLVGVVADATWGQVMALGFGGFLVEVLPDHALGVLPLSDRDIREMLESLTGFRLLTGYRGRQPADLDRLVEVIGGVARLAEALGDRVTSLEVNPLMVTGDRIEALDVLITPTEPSASAHGNGAS
jgi:acyl-CoA synthetase (NDP forming)